MANNLVQFRTDEQTKLQATAICNKLGLDLQSYLRICLARLVEEKGIPFSMHVSEDNKGIAAMRRAQKVSAENGNDELSLTEINAEIDEARR